MDQKPIIQYVGQFYVYGSEAQAPKKKKEEKKQILPSLPKPKKDHCIYIDPVAVCGIVLAAVVLVLLVMGAFQLKNAMEDYDRQSQTLSAVRRENAVLEHQYRTGLDLESVQTQAEKLGMVASSEVETRRIHVNVPEHPQEETLLQRIWWHVRGLLYGVDESKTEVFEKDDLLHNGTPEDIQ